MPHQVFIDASGGGQGGTTVNIGGDLTNSGTFNIGNGGLSLPTNVTVAGTLDNTGGIINLQGNTAASTTNQATLNIQGAMPATVAGQLNVSGDALLQVTNGITAVGSGAQLSVNGENARVSLGAGTTNSGLAGLASNSGTFQMRGNTSWVRAAPRSRRRPGSRTPARPISTSLAAKAAAPSISAAT